MILRPQYLDTINHFIGKPVIKIITGMRRVGKSTLLAMVREQLIAQGIPAENIILLNLENLEFRDIGSGNSLYSYIKQRLKHLSGQVTIMLDEVQEVPGWEKAVNSLLVEELGDVFITGSNAHLLSSELATLLTGRYVEITVYPLSFREFLDFRGLTTQSPRLTDEFRLYVKYGGLPGLHYLKFIDEALVPFLKSMINTIVYKDIIQRHQIRSPYLLERVLQFVQDNCGNITTAKSIADYLKSQHIKCSVDSVLNYLGYFEESFLVHRASRYDIKGKRRLELFDKFYPADMGLRFGLIGYREQDIGALLENIVYLELRRRGYTVTVGTFDGLEIDFVAEKQDERKYFQVAYLLADEKTVKREFGNLEKIPDNYPKSVLSLDPFFIEEQKGIRHQGILDFLLQT